MEILRLQVSSLLSGDCIYNKTTVNKRGKPRVTNLNVDTALLQEAIELEGEIAIETLVEIALREYIQLLGLDRIHAFCQF